jgi:hypothetical protein
MSERSTRVVGISPGARWTGIAAVQGDLLFRFDIITTGRYLGRASILRKRLVRMLRELEPEVVVLEQPGARRLARELREIDRVVASAVAELGVALVRGSLPAARRLVAAPEKPTRAIVHHRLVSRFPQLARSSEARPDRRYWADLDRYWERAFAALALALGSSGEGAASGAAGLAPPGAHERAPLPPQLARRPGAK